MLHEVQLKCTVMDEGMQKNKKWGFPGSQEEPSSHLEFPIATTIHLVYSPCLPVQYALEVCLNLLHNAPHGI